MLCQQLHIFVFMAVAMVRLSAAAHFDCDNTLGYIFCDISLNSDNDFNFSGQDDAVDCTRDGEYCARVESIPNDNTEWKIVVQKWGVLLWRVPRPTTLRYGGDCYDTCQADAC